MAQEETYPPITYPRHRLTLEQLHAAKITAIKLSRLKQRDLIIYVSRLIAENMSLAVECNAHRAARGFDQIQIYDPETK